MNNDVWVVAEHTQDALQEITFELLGKAREVAGKLGGKVGVVLMGHGTGSLMAQLGAAGLVVQADRPEFHAFTSEAYGAALEAALKGERPRLILLGSTSEGLDLLSLLSGRLGLPCLDNGTRLEVRDGKPLVTCQVYGGKIFAEVALPEETTLVAVVPGSFPGEAGKVIGTPEVRALTFEAAAIPSRITFRKRIEPPPGDVDITRMPVLVAVGRGIQNADNLPLAEELAEVLGGAVCASRPVIDQGWLPLTRQVGKSGMTVKPKLYLAFGISGAPEHLEGMKQSELVVAVNTDAKAPIFGAAHFGAVADAVDVIEALIEEVKKATLKKAG